MTTIDQLRRRGRVVELVAALEAELAAPPAGAPYREDGDRLAEAARWHELGRWQWQAARFDAADRSLARALEVREGLLGAEHPETLDTLERIAALRHYQRRDDAGARFEKVLAAREATVGRGDPATAVTLRNYGAHLRDEGDPRAEAVLVEARDTLERTLGSEHPEYAAALKAHALLVIGLQEHGEWRGLDLARRAWSVTLRCHGDDHPFTGGAILVLARGEERARRIRPARRRYQQAREIIAATCGEHHPLVAFAASGIGNMDFAESKVSDAITAWQEAIRIYQVTYPVSELGVNTMFQIAEGCLYLGRGDDALTWVERGLAEAPALAGDKTGIAEWLVQLEAVAEAQGDLVTQAKLHRLR